MQLQIMLMKYGVPILLEHRIAIYIVRYLLMVLDVFSKYGWIELLKS